MTNTAIKTYADLIRAAAASRDVAFRKKCQAEDENYANVRAKYIECLYPLLLVLQSAKTEMEHKLYVFRADGPTVSYMGVQWPEASSCSRMHAALSDTIQVRVNEDGDPEIRLVSSDPGTYRVNAHHRHKNAEELVPTLVGLLADASRNRDSR